MTTTTKTKRQRRATTPAPVPMDTLETKEHAALAWPPDAPAPEEADHVEEEGEPTPAAPDPQEAVNTARAALAEEWHRANPQTPEEVAAFYREAQGIGDDLAAWHQLPDRQEWTRLIVHVAQQAEVQKVVDVGCGAGHDLLALRAALPDAVLCGVEPNSELRARLLEHVPCMATAHDAPVEQADLLLCIDVLEHVPDPEAFLADLARRAPVGCLLIEATATHDTATPLHLPQNRGWHPGRCLEAHGWEVVDRLPGGRLRVWRRETPVGVARAALLLCAYRSITAGTMESIMGVVAGSGAAAQRWRFRCKSGDGMISRSRGILVSDWWRSTHDDVCLFVDDDVVFDPADAHRIVERCRSGYDIIAGAYPVHDGGHLACKTLPGDQTIAFGPGQEPIEIMYAATGFLCLHRRVIDALVHDLPLMHANQAWSYYQLFPFLVALNEATGCLEVLSEDWSFSHMARQKGFKVYLDPSIILRHASTIPLSVLNMNTVHAAIAGA